LSDKSIKTSPMDQAHCSSIMETTYKDNLLMADVRVLEDLLKLMEVIIREILKII